MRLSKLVGRVVAYGYNVYEVPLPKQPKIKRGVRVSPVKHQRGVTRSPVLVSLWCHLVGFAPPHPNPSRGGNVREGALYRYLRKPPTPKIMPTRATASERPRRLTSYQLRRRTAKLQSRDALCLEGLAQFVDRWLEKNMTPLTESPSVFEWLDHCNYPLWRKLQLWVAHTELLAAGSIWAEKAWTQLKCFMKMETYFTWKWPRGINARDDHFKVFCGPVFAAIEKVLFSKFYFIKKVPVADRPRHIMERLFRYAGVYLATDYTAFESLFTPELMRTCELRLYRYMVREMPGGDEWFDVIQKVLTGVNVCKYRDFTVEVLGTRMSGEMCTSLGNSFTNLMIMLYILELHGTENADCYVEGDDGLARPDFDFPDDSPFTDLGLLVKADRYTELSEASFCGLIFDPDELINVTDPREVLLNFGWTRSIYAGASKVTLMALLRAKALSLLYQYPGCPIIQSLAQYGLRHTAHLSNKFALARASKTANQYEIDLYMEMQGLDIVARPVGRQTRLLVERKYDVTVESQLRIEAYLATAPLGPLNIDLEFPEASSDFFHRYVRELECGRLGEIPFEWPASQPFDNSPIDTTAGTFPNLPADAGIDLDLARDPGGAVTDEYW